MNKMKKIIRYVLFFVMLLLITASIAVGWYFYKNQRSASVDTITVSQNFSILSAAPKQSAEAAAIIVATKDNHFTADQLLTLSESTGAKLVQFELQPQGSCAEQQTRFEQAQKILNEDKFVVAGMQ